MPTNNDKTPENQIFEKYYINNILNKPTKNITPHEFNLIYNKQIKQHNKTKIIQKILEQKEEYKKLNQNQQSQIIFLYKEYNYIKKIISGKIQHFEGIQNSTDKTINIINQNIKKIFEQENYTPTYNNYNNPEKNTINTWFKLIDSLRFFNLGQTDKTIIALEELDYIYDRINNKKLF